MTVLSKVDEAEVQEVPIPYILDVESQNSTHGFSLNSELFPLDYTDFTSHFINYFQSLKKAPLRNEEGSTYHSPSIM